jgi:hypothetical protein
MKVIVATHNAGKVKELESMLRRLGYTFESLLDHSDAKETNETGETFEENALLKATEAAAYQRVSNRVACLLRGLSDISGDEVSSADDFQGSAFYIVALS